ncbi:MAG TPA: arylamine N-acetyltransferase [Actinomycetota bacterium]|nr:arylamine N-acetyltransferase [Actinomycetota bacterium]
MNVDRYLARIGYDGLPRSDAKTLAALQRAHLRSIPFEAFDPARRIVPSLDPGALFDKVVERARGGFCFELNGLFALLLENLGFSVTRVAAQPWVTETDRAPTFSHLALVVDASGDRWLTDVGFGASVMQPLRLADSDVQNVDGVPYVVRADETPMHFRRIDIIDGYDFDLVPRALSDFAEQCRTYATDDDSPFTRFGPCWRWTPDGWVGVRRDRFARIVDGVLDEQPFSGGENAYVRAVRERIGIAI